MKRKLGVVCMIVGAVLLLGALALLTFNHTQAQKAQQFSSKAVTELKNTIADNKNKKTDSSDFSGTTTDNEQINEVRIDGYSYIGYLSIPSQGLELPVMSGWDYDKLNIAPCRYSGTVEEENLVVIAHNYSSHFGNLDQLGVTDEVLFTDINGDVTIYQVACVDVVPPSSANEVVSGDFDLTLVTCTYGGKTRFVVYCDELQNNSEIQN
ncbi:MAG: sortase [Ruminococcus sp.]|nr:sortase [Ruminococcus sp.]